jgi:hypothetical protein
MIIAIRNGTAMSRIKMRPIWKGVFVSQQFFYKDKDAVPV